MKDDGLMKKLLLIALIFFSCVVNATRLNLETGNLDARLQSELTKAIDNQFEGKQKVFVSVFNNKVLLYGDVTKIEFKAEAINLVTKDKVFWSGHFPTRLIDQITVNQVVPASETNLDNQILDSMKARLPENLVKLTKITVFNGKVYLLGVVTKSEGDLIASYASQTSNVKSVYKIFDVVSDSDAQRSDQLPKQ